MGYILKDEHLEIVSPFGRVKPASLSNFFFIGSPYLTWRYFIVSLTWQIAELERGC
jgi:hypothetical protein